MAWKDLSYWLKGVLIGLIVGTISFLCQRISIFIFDLKVSFLNPIAGLLLILGIVSFIIGLPYYWSLDYGIKEMLGINCTINWFNSWCDYGSPLREFMVRIVLPGLFIILLSIILGALIGWIVGKIKNKQNGVKE